MPKTRSRTVFKVPTNYLVSYSIYFKIYLGKSQIPEWKVRFPGLTPLEFFSIRCLKLPDYFNKPENIEVLKNKISAKTRQIQPYTLTEVPNVILHNT